MGLSQMQLSVCICADLITLFQGAYVCNFYTVTTGYRMIVDPQEQGAVGGTGNIEKQWGEMENSRGI